MKILAVVLLVALCGCSSNRAMYGELAEAKAMYESGLVSKTGHLQQYVGILQKYSVNSPEEREFIAYVWFVGSKWVRDEIDTSEADYLITAKYNVLAARNQDRRAAAWDNFALGLGQMGRGLAEIDAARRPASVPIQQQLRCWSYRSGPNVYTNCR